MIPVDELKTKALASFSLSRILWATLATGGRLIKEFALDTPADDPKIRADVQNWARKLCRAMNVRITLRGAPLDTTPGLLVGNHMSYIDVPVLLALEPMGFVAKAEVQKMPVIGPAAEGFGVIFIERNSDKSRKSTSESLTKAILENNRRVVVFPEGTTSLKGLPWRAGVFKLAQEQKIPMQAMAISYQPADKASFQISSMLDHAMELPDAGPIEAYVTFSEPFFVTDFLKDFEKWEKWSKDIVSADLARQGIA